MLNHHGRIVFLLRPFFISSPSLLVTIPLNKYRAMNNIGWFRDAGGTVSERIGVTGFGPNINQPYVRTAIHA